MVTRRDITERLASILGEQLVIERELGGGGMSRVFVAHEPSLGRRVVIKVLPEDLATALSRERFRREILTSATLQHPNIVSVFAAGDADGLLYFIMPYVDGESLRGRLQRDGSLSPVAAVSILRDILRALAFAHDRGVVHRDIKPDNVLLSHGAAVVADFGVAKAFASAREGTSSSGVTLTGVGMSLGTPAYMAPEQVAGDTKLDARTDIYALGALAYEMLTGRAVFPRSNVADVLRAHLAEKPEPVSALRPGIPAALEAAVLQCLEKDPDRRPQSAAELLSRLDDPDVVSGAVSSAVAVTPLRRRPRALLMAAALVALVLGVATVSSVMSNAGESGATGSSAVAPVPTVAVLPLVAASGDSSDRYLAFGVTDEIISALAQARGIRVASRAAAEEAQRAGLSLAQLRERFAVTHALEGTIQRVGSDLRVAVRLLGTADGLTVWSEVFDASATDLLEVQRFIAQAIAAAVQEDLGGTPDTNAGTSTSQPPPNTPGTG
jgi:serine/threonine-protein kinase